MAKQATINRERDRRGVDRREIGRRLDERRKHGYGEVLPDRRAKQRRLAIRREMMRRERAERRG